MNEAPSNKVEKRNIFGGNKNSNSSKKIELVFMHVSVILSLTRSLCVRAATPLA